MEKKAVKTIEWQASIYCGLGQINLLQCALAAFVVCTTFCYFFDATLTTKMVMAWQCMAEKKTVTHYHIIPRAGSRNKRLSPGNMLQGSVHQFLSQALPSMSTECQGGDVLGESGQFQDSGGFVQWEGGELTTDQGTSQWEPTRTLTTGPSSKG